MAIAAPIASTALTDLFNALLNHSSRIKLSHLRKLVDMIRKECPEDGGFDDVFEDGMFDNNPDDNIEKNLQVEKVQQYYNKTKDLDKKHTADLKKALVMGVVYIGWGVLSMLAAKNHKKFLEDVKDDIENLRPKLVDVRAKYEKDHPRVVAMLDKALAGLSEAMKSLKQGDFEQARFQQTSALSDAVQGTILADSLDREVKELSDTVQRLVTDAQRQRGVSEAGFWSTLTVLGASGFNIFASLANPLTGALRTAAVTANVVAAGVNGVAVAMHVVNLANCKAHLAALISIQREVEEMRSQTKALKDSLDQVTGSLGDCASSITSATGARSS